MTHNESTVDRGIRAVLGVAALVWALFVGVGSLMGIVLVALAAVLLVTAAVGFCPLYRLLHVSTASGGKHGETPVAQ